MVADDLIETIGAAGQTDRAVRQLLVQFRDRRRCSIVCSASFERQCLRWIHRQRHRAAVIEAADLRSDRARFRA